MIKSTSDETRTTRLFGISGFLMPLAVLFDGELFGGYLSFNFVGIIWLLFVLAALSILAFRFLLILGSARSGSWQIVAPLLSVFGLGVARLRQWRKVINHRDHKALGPADYSPFVSHFDFGGK